MTALQYDWRPATAGTEPQGVPTVSDVVITQHADRIATITLNRPQALNAISGELAGNLKAAIRAANEDPAVDGMVLTGTGDKALCAGVDLLEAIEALCQLARYGGDAKLRDRIDLALQGVHLRQPAFDSRTDKPFICAINGIAAGGGFQMALVSDLRVGHAGTKMGQPEINAGIPSVMGSYWMS